MRHVLSIDDLAADELRFLVDRAEALKKAPRGFEDALERRTLLLLLAKPSLRTRLSFEVAMDRLGGQTISYQASESTVGKKETWRDLGAVSSRYVDVIVARLYAQRELEELASGATVPVVNGLTDHEHPCQTLGDLVAIDEAVGLRQARVAYVGDARNNVTHSLLLAAAKLGLDVRIACPAAYRPEPDVMARAQALARDSGASLAVTEDPIKAVAHANVVYTDTWMSYHVEPAERDARVEALSPYRVDAGLMASAAPGARFMHCLPATRGEEVTAEVLDSPASIVLEQAEDRLHAQKALLLWLLRPSLLHSLPPEAS